MNGDSPYPQIGPIGKVLPQLTPVEIMGRTSGDGSDDEANSSPISSLDKRHAHTHTMSTRRVCWHRNTSISMQEHSLSVRVSSEQCSLYINFEWIFKLNNPIQVLHERRVGTRDVLRTLWIRTTFCGITRLSIKKMENH